MRKKIIINADDFGVIPSVDKAVTELVLEGKINSVAAFSNFHQSVSNAQNLIKVAKTAGKQLDLGVHLTISSGQPVLTETWKQEHGLCDASGNFKSFTELSVDAINKEVLKNELIAQVERFTSAGIPVKHLSCHHNTLTCFEDLFRIYAQVALETGLSMRSVDIHPGLKDNLYTKVFLGVVLRDDNDHQDMKARRAFLNNIRTKFEAYTEKKVKSPGYLESAYYGPLPGTQIMGKRLDERVNQKKETLHKILTRFAEDERETMELMVHLRDGDVSWGTDYAAEVEKVKYTGVDPRYFDSRVVEFCSLKETNLDDLFGQFGITFGSWDDL